MLYERPTIADELSVFDHFVKLALKGLKKSICNAYMSIHSYRMMASSSLLTIDLLDICIFCKLSSL